MKPAQCRRVSLPTGGSSYIQSILELHNEMMAVLLDYRDIQRDTEKASSYPTCQPSEPSIVHLPHTQATTAAIHLSTYLLT